MRAVRFAILVSIAVCLSACAPTYCDLTSGSLESRKLTKTELSQLLKDTAVIHGLGGTRVISVDGIDLSRTSAGSDVLILPGRHTVGLNYKSPRFVWWHAFVFLPPIVNFPYYGDVEFTAESGVRYEAVVEYQDDLNARGLVREQFTGQIVGMGILSAPESGW